MTREACMDSVLQKWNFKKLNKNRELKKNILFPECFLARREMDIFLLKMILNYLL